MRSDTAKGLVIGVAVAVLVPVVLPVVARASKPLGRAAARTGLVLYEKGRETLAEMGEVVEDFIAETRSELEAHAAAAEAAAAAAEEVAEESGEETAAERARHTQSAE